MNILGLISQLIGIKTLRLTTYSLVNCGFVRMGNDATCTIIVMRTIKIKMFDVVVRTLE